MNEKLQDLCKQLYTSVYTSWAAADHVLVILHLVSIPVHPHNMHNTCPTLSHFTSFLCHIVTLICVYHNAFMFTVALGALPPPTSLASVPLTQLSAYAQPTTNSTGLIPQSQRQAAPGGLILSPTSAPFPQKLVDKIKSGQFIEMRELLAANISLIQQLEALQGSMPIPMAGPTRPRLREISSLATWLHCFLAYTAILTTDPSTRDKLAYARLIIHEALRHGNLGWLDYDRSFRQQTAVDPSVAWNTMLPALQATTILGNATQPGRSATVQCNVCQGVDHPPRECGLSFLYSFPLRTPQQNSSKQKICTSWNKGVCIFPNTCTYSHVCATCPGARPYKACECSKTPDNSIYKQRRPANKSN